MIYGFGGPLVRWWTQDILFTQIFVNIFVNTAPCRQHLRVKLKNDCKFERAVVYNEIYSSDENNSLLYVHQINLKI